MNLPNSLTLIRIFLVPLLVVVLLTRVEWPVMGVSSQVLGAAIFAVASLTDWLDGYVARRRKQVTTLGQLMDPIADKLLTAAAFISLVQMGAAPAWMVAVIIGREFAVTGLRSIAYSRGTVIASSPHGQGQDDEPGRRHPAPHPGPRTVPAVLPARTGRVVGGGDPVGRVGRRLLPQVRARRIAVLTAESAGACYFTGGGGSAGCSFSASWALARKSLCSNSFVRRSK